MNYDFIFTSYIFDNEAANGDYRGQQERLRESILKIYSGVPLHFIAEPESIGKPKFQRSMYGFKVQMIKDCLAMGFKKIIFLDAAICLEQKIDPWLELAKVHGVLGAADSNPLSKVSSDKVLNYCGITREEAADINLVGGSIYVFDFNTELCERIFSNWALMESEGMFGTQEDCTNGKMQNHRMDETCMALAMHKEGIKALGHREMQYAWEHPETKKITKVEGVEPIVIKRHFK